jgi:hypothetical protein
VRDKMTHRVIETSSKNPENRDCENNPKNKNKINHKENKIKELTHNRIIGVSLLALIPG